MARALSATGSPVCRRLPVAHWRWPPTAGSNWRRYRRRRRMRRYSSWMRISAPPCWICDPRAFSSGANCAGCFCGRGLIGTVGFRACRIRACRFRLRRRIVVRGCPCGRCSRETHKQPCRQYRQYQCRAPAGFDGHWQSPHLPAPRGRNETPWRVRSGAEKGNFRAGAAKAGQPNLRQARFQRVRLGMQAGAAWMPAEPIDVMSLRAGESRGSSKAAKRS